MEILLKKFVRYFRSMERNVLVLGDGLLGSEIVKQTGWEYISRKKGDFDINDLDTLKGYIPDVIVNCIGNTNTYSNDKESHWDINYKFVSNLIQFCNINEIKLIHISTDYLYTNSVNNASETDIPIHGENWYSYTKLLSDGLVQLQSNDYLICRCGHKPQPFIYDKAWSDQIGNFDYVFDISKLIVILINKGASGVYNVGTEIKSMYNLASRTKKNVGKTKAPKSAPKDITMNLNKLNDGLA